MEQVGGEGRGRVEQMGGVQQPQDRRVKASTGENQQPPPQQPQKCPRCESLNTKFCYYNNYSLSQPRYFCKTCRRYWTQGGTLRNVPVGGGCRKGKRSKRPSSADHNPSIRSSTAISASATASVNTAVISTTTGETDLMMAAAASNPIPSMVSAPSSSVYYGGGGFLSSFATLQSFNPSMNVGGDFGGSNLALLQGFGPPSFTPQQQQVQQSQVFHMGNRETKPLQVFAPEENVIQGSSNTRPSTSHQNWPQSFMEASNPKSESTYWTSSANNTTNTTTTTTNNNTTTGSPLWLSDLPGYGHSSQPFL